MIHLPPAEPWFAWFPVITRDSRLVWLRTVMRERYITPNRAGAWRYSTPQEN